MPTGCFDGARWRPPISWPNGSTAISCARRWRRAGSPEPSPGQVVGGHERRHPLPGRAERAGHPRPRRFPGAASVHFAGALAAATRAAGGEIRMKSEVSRIVVRDGRCRASCSRAAKRSRREPSFQARIRRRRSCGLSIRRSSARNSSNTCGTSAPQGRRRRSTSRFRRFRHSPATARPGSAGASTSGRGSTHSNALSTPPSTATSRKARTSTWRSPRSSIRRWRRQAAHVLSVLASFAPYRLRAATGARAAMSWAMRSKKTIADCARLEAGRRAPRARSSRSRGGVRDVGRASLPRRAGARPALTMRPFLGWARYASPIGGLYLCGAGTHPGGGVTGLPGWNAAREIRERSDAGRASPGFPSKFRASNPLRTASGSEPTPRTRGCRAKRLESRRRTGSASC